MRWRVAWCAVALLLAGCSGEQAVVPEEEEDFDEFELEETPEELGVIRGVVVDAAIQPLAGAVVGLSGHEAKVTTKENGAFAFKDLEPGAYFVQVERLGYKETQTSTQVEAGVKEPPVLRIMLERMPGTEPAIVPDHFQGHITCSIRNPALGYNDGCLVFGNLGLGSTQEKHMQFPAGNLQWIQTEVDWVPASLTAERLCSTVWGAETTPSGEGNVNNAVCGPSSLIRTLNQTQLEAAGLHQEKSVRYATYPDHLLADVSGNLVIDQDFELFIHAFYNFLPPEGWEFGRDGLPPVPA